MACLQPAQRRRIAMRQSEVAERLVPVGQAGTVERLAGRRRQQPDACGAGAAGQLAEQGQAAAIRRAAWVAGNGQALRRVAGQLLQQQAALFAAVDDAGVGNAGGQPGWPTAAVVQLDAEQKRAVALTRVHACLRLVQGTGGGIAHAQAFAVGLQALAQQAVARQLNVQAQGALAGPPTPQAQQRQQQAWQQTVDQQHTDQPAGPALPCGFADQDAVATGADQLGGRQAEAQQGGQGADGLGQGNERLAAQDGGFPDKTVTPGGQHQQHADQRAEHGQRPEPVHQQAEPPTHEALALQHQQQGGGQLYGTGIAGQLFTQPQPEPAEGAGVVATKQQAEQPGHEQQQVEPEQAAQGPEHVDRLLAVAEGGQCQPGAAEQGQQGHRQQGQAGALQPVQQGWPLAVAAGQRQRAVGDALGQIATLGAGLAIGLGVFERAGVFFTQANRLAEPEALKRVGLRGGVSHASSRW